MRWPQILRLRLRALLRAGAVDHDLDDELQGHLQYLVDEHIARGLSPCEARDQARREFGGVVRLKEECRDSRGVTWLTDIGRDLTYGARMLRRTPAFTTAAVLTLALGIGANTAILSLVNTVLLRLLPVDRPQALVFVQAAGSEGRGGTPPYPYLERLRSEAPSFAGLAGAATDQLRVEVDGTLEQVEGQIASGNYFEVLGVKPAAGRLLTIEDDKLDPPAAVIGYGYWQRRFGGDPRAIGTPITFAGRVFTIVGVTAPEFRGLDAGRQLEVTLPITHAGQLLSNLQTWSWYGIVARLRPDTSAEQATAQADAIFQSFMSAGIQSEDMRVKRFARIELTSAARGYEGLRSRFSRPLYALTIVAALVLLIACVNLSNLLLVRGTARTREFAIRLATGAGAGRLLRQQLTETGLLFLIGAIAGVGVAAVVVRGLTGFFAIGRNPIVLDVRYDWPLAVMAAGVSLLAALATGFWPAYRASRTDPHAALKDSEGRVAGSRRVTLSARALVSSQVALSLVLTVGAVMFVRTIVNLRAVDLGFRPDRVLTMSVDPVVSGADPGSMRRQLWQQMLTRVRAIPGVRAASVSVLTPLSGRDTGRPIAIAGFQPQSRLDAIVHLNHVSEDYFQTFGIELVAGRAFTANDGGNAPKVVVINEAAEQAFFGGRRALGDTIRFGDRGDYEVVGVVRNAKHRSLREQPARFAFVPVWQPVDGLSRITLSVSTAAAAPALARRVMDEVRAVYPQTLTSDVIDAEEQIDATLVGEALLSRLASGFAALAVALAAIGLYGVLSYSVARRRSEFGVRLALGARPARIASGLAREVALQVGVGLAAGLPLALIGARATESLLFGVTPLDPRNYLTGAAVLTLVTIAAAYVPARRAAKIDPMTALRTE
jgi:predicted permease